MNKRHPKKLQLSKLTVRALGAVALRRAHGGGGWGNDLLNADDVIVVQRTYYQDSYCLC